MESDTGGKTLHLVVDLKCEADLPEGASCAAILAMAARAVSNFVRLRDSMVEKAPVCVAGSDATQLRHEQSFSHVTSEAVSFVSLAGLVETCRKL